MPRHGIAAAVIAAVVCCSIGPAAASADPPYDPPDPVLEGPPLQLPVPLSPAIGSLPLGAPFGETLLPHVVGGDTPQLVVRRLAPQSGSVVGEDVTVSDASSVPAGEDAGVAFAYRQRQAPIMTPAAVAASADAIAATSAVGAASADATAEEANEWLVVWVARDADGERVVGRRIAQDGAPLAPPVTLSETTHERIDEVAVVHEGYGRTALVTWRGVRAGDAGRAQVVVQGWDPDQGRIAPEALQLSDPAGDAVGSLAIEGMPWFGYLVVWRGSDPPLLGSDEQEVLARTLAPGGAPTRNVLRLSQVGTDGDLAARPLAATVGDEAFWPQQPWVWGVAWTEAPGDRVRVRLVAGDGWPSSPQTVGPVAAGETIGRLALTTFLSGRQGLAYDVGAAGGPRRVELQQLTSDGAQEGSPLTVSQTGEQASGPAFVRLGYTCRRLLVWHGAELAAARHVDESGCPLPYRYPFGEPPVVPPSTPPTPPRAPRVPRRIAPSPRFALRDVRLTPHRFALGQRANLRLRVTAPAAIAVTLQPRVAGGWRHLRPARATVRRVHVRRAGRVAIAIGGRDGSGRPLRPGRYRLLVRASSVGGRGAKPKQVVARVPFTLLPGERRGAGR
ncbi:hypothetical protein [Conexibacter sp. CPCC 206217]|uniref:hypothetical protein n=1 Tax=Conexibacter sp. CPCC 206217 TaxID=3064574 RepID=UPI0027156BF4|nr:hypothetical protein [Conexibacter sp. CPCC 206217]MDO8213812.1 hypothetical protein [Conexibacter sp. CPCC 206217]